MRLQGTMRINECGRLEIGGCDTADLARTFGTPLQIIDEQLLRRNCEEYRTSFGSGGHADLVLYASKALLNRAICRIIHGRGAGAGRGVRRRTLYRPAGRVSPRPDLSPRQQQIA